MNNSIQTRMTYAISAGAPITIIGVLVSKVGWVDGQMGNILLTQFAPFVLCAALTWLVRRKHILGWIVFGGTMLAAIYGFIGLYGGFWREPAKGAWDVVYRPFQETIIVVTTGLVVLCAALWRRKKASMEKSK
jgi:hypothetical protein